MADLVKIPQLFKRADQTADYRELLKYYTFVGSQRSIEGFLDEEPSFLSILQQAVVPLKGAFGEKRLISIKAQTQDDDKMLRVTVQLPCNIDFDPEERLQRFDTAWWLDNCHRAGGGLVFDYEMHDAV